jgi:site-specific DNA-methyltransferase (adenine-specific)
MKFGDVNLDIMWGDNLYFLRGFKDSRFDLIYIDPPFNTGKSRRKRFSLIGYDDSYDDYLDFIKVRLVEARRVLRSTGSLFFHVDYREAHYCKIILDRIFGRNNFMNEIIWAYDYGGRSRVKWSAKHDNIFWYVADKKNYTFNYDESDRIPYLATGLVGSEKARLGKTPTDTWWATIVGTNSAERTGYPTQKPLSIMDRIVRVHSNKGDDLLDFFAGSGSFGYSALKYGRNVDLIDNNKDAIFMMSERFGYPINMVIKEKRGICLIA